MFKILMRRMNKITKEHANNKINTNTYKILVYSSFSSLSPSIPTKPKFYHFTMTYNYILQMTVGIFLLTNNHSFTVHFFVV